VKILLNHNLSEKRVPLLISPEEVYAFHRELPGYNPTPLISCESIANSCGVKKILVKDEGERFGLKAFKALGASYAMYHYLYEKSGYHLSLDKFFSDEGRNLADGITFYCATDGNHGKAVAWIAKHLGARAIIYVPESTAPARINAIKSEGAEVIVAEGGYDEAVWLAGKYSDWIKNIVISDVAYPGNMKLPLYIQQGYLTMFYEISLQLKERDEIVPDLVFIQAGVGSFASSAASFFNDPKKGPCLISVEPESARCLFHSADISDGQPHSFVSPQKTIMAGLNCETPSLTAWPVIRDRYHAFISIEDTYTEEAMSLLAKEGIVSGESGAAGLAGLIALRREYPEFIENNIIKKQGVTVLIINTEADTDPEAYQKIVGRSSEQVLSNTNTKTLRARKK
jgi:diaminopropionate ammonia-lyase